MKGKGQVQRTCVSTIYWKLRPEARKHHMIIKPNSKSDTRVKINLLIHAAVYISNRRPYSILFLPSSALEYLAAVSPRSCLATRGPSSGSFLTLLIVSWYPSATYGRGLSLGQLTYMWCQQTLIRSLMVRLSTIIDLRRACRFSRQTAHTILQRRTRRR